MASAAANTTEICNTREPRYPLIYNTVKDIQKWQTMKRRRNNRHEEREERKGCDKGQQMGDGGRSDSEEE